MRRYWSEAVARIPALRFTVEGVCQVVDSIVINYRNRSGNVVNEVLTFSDGAVTRPTAPTGFAIDPAAAIWTGRLLAALTVSFVSFGDVG